MEWIPISIPPKISGKYLIGHRGTQKITHFFTNDKVWVPMTKMGWQDDPRLFGATHYMFLEPPPVVERTAEQTYLFDPPKVGSTVEIFQDGPALLLASTHHSYVRKVWWKFWQAKTERVRRDYSPAMVTKGSIGTVVSVEGHPYTNMEVEIKLLKQNRVVWFNKQTGFHFKACLVA